MAVRTTTLRTGPALDWRAALADRIAALRSGARAIRSEAREPREPIRSHSFKDDPNFWLRSL